MSINKHDQHILEAAEQSLDDASKVILKSRVAGFDDTTYPPFDPLVGLAIDRFVRTYRGGNGFLNNLRTKVDKGLSIRQRRAVAHILAQALNGNDLDDIHGAPKSGPAPAAPPALNGQDPIKKGELDDGAEIEPVRADLLRNAGFKFYANKCYTCNKLIVGSYDYLMNVHKPDCGKSPSDGNYFTNNGTRNTRQLERSKPLLDLDLRVLPPKGRYAIEDENGDFLFFLVETRNKAGYLTGRFRWSKYPSRPKQRIEKGAIIVRKQAGDTREFIGIQEVNDDFYHGDYEPNLKAVLEDPAKAMIEYGRRIGACAYCGRSLTDEDSRARGIGPDCWEEKHIPFLTAQGMSEIRKIRGY